jgi:CRISP-associated protein Cas1
MRRATSIAAPIAHLVGPGKLKVVNGHLAFAAREKPGPLRLDPQALRSIFCYGPVGVSDEALQVLFAHEVEVAWLTPAGSRCRGRLVRSDPPRTMLRLLQHRALADPRQSPRWASLVVATRIESQLKAARHYQRQGRTMTGDALPRLQALRDRCGTATLEQLRGLEGAASALWFEILGQLLNPPWTFTQRTRRPPLDPVNALLSLGYTWLLARTVARCEASGLEVNLGGLHEYRPGRPSLACDVMEPLRVPAVDRWVVGLCNQNLIAANDFRIEESGVRLQVERFPVILCKWEEYWQSQGHEAELDRWLGELIAWLRRNMTTEDVDADTSSSDAL